MQNETHFFDALRIAIAVRLYTIKDFLRCSWKYYRDWKFAKLDFSLLLSYFWESPYHINRRLRLEPYGETPLATMEKIAKEAQISSDDRVYELGCGRGRCLFWLSHFIGCTTIGIEYNPLFVDRANWLKEYFHIHNASFVLGDMLQSDLQEATVIYLYGTLLSEDDIRKLIEKFAKLKKRTRIITISYALTEYSERKNLFRILKEFEVEFAWGKTSAFLQEV